MAKGSRKVVVFFLLLPLLYASFLRLSSIITVRDSGNFRMSYWPSSLSILRSESSEINKEEHMELLLQRLVRGRDRRQLNLNGVSCVSDANSAFCVTSGAVRITTGDKPIVHLTAGQNLSTGEEFMVQPYPRRTDTMAMNHTTRVTITDHTPNTPACDVSHDVPAVVVSTGGFCGNFFHDINDVVLPMFLTAGHFRSQVQFVIADYKPHWTKKYRRILQHITAYDVVPASSSRIPLNTTVHCFPSAVVGVKYHSYLECNSSDAPGGITTLDFKRFLHESFSLKTKDIFSAVNNKPILVLISRRRTRALLNEDQVAQLADEMGFQVEIAPPWRIRKLEEFAELVNSCSVMMGVHGAGMTNLVFLPAGAVVLQVVPFGLNWVAKTYYGSEPTARFELKYVDYWATPKESSLYNKYPKDHPVLTDPTSVHKKGYMESKKVYLDGQNVTLDISRFRASLLRAKNLIDPTSLS